MPDDGTKYDFFLSRRGSVAAIAQEVADVLREQGYRVLVQDYDMPLGSSFIERMHEAVKNSRDLVVLYTSDYEQSAHTRRELASFEAEAAQSLEERHTIVLRCEDVPLRGLLADRVYQDLVGIDDADERKRRIVAAAERQSQAAPPPPRPFIGVPPRIASFTGRADELDQLDAVLMQGKPAALTQVGRAAVHGMGGVGKTSLATEYAHRYRNLYTGVCWCPAETRAGLLSSLASLAVRLGAATAQHKDVQDAAKAALRWLAEQRATWLLIYDNVRTPDDLAEFLPSAGARVLLTSRFSDWGELAEEVALDVLPLDEAVALLETRAGRNDAIGANTLAEVLGRLPLALDHGAAYCRRAQMSFRDYADRVLGLIDLAPRGATYPRSIAATFEIAIAEAATQSGAAERMISFLAQCAPERIPMMLIEGAIGHETDRLDAVASLAEVSLLKHDPFDDETPAVTVHRLVQAVARGRSEKNGTRDEAIARIITQLWEIYPTDAHEDPQSWPLCAQLTPHALALWQASPEGSSASAEWADVLNRVGQFFHGRAYYSEAIELLHASAEIRERVFGPNHPDTSISIHNIALVLRDQGNLEGARTLYERVLQIRETALGPNDPRTAIALNSLAGVLAELGDLGAAQAQLERAVQILENTAGAPALIVGATLDSLAGVYHHQGKQADARALYERALAVREEGLGSEHPHTASSLHNLALALKDEGDFEAAQPLLERALSICERHLGPEHPATASNLFTLGELLGAQGQFAEARSLLQRALAIREKTHGPNHHLTATTLNSIANTYHANGELELARLHYERAQVILEDALGPKHQLTNRVRSDRAMLFLHMGDPAGALPLGEAALAAHDEVLGPNHPWTLQSASITASALDMLGRIDKAKVLREKYGLTGPAAS
jgi:tetratricopeptide (TPR) repeat protein